LLCWVTGFLPSSSPLPFSYALKRMKSDSEGLLLGHCSMMMMLIVD
jgi:hypothetical protein